MIEFEEDNEDEETEEDEEEIDETDENDEDEEEYEEDDEDEVDVEVLEFSLGEEDINELIEKLETLRETKLPVEFDIDEENQIIINYDEEGDENE